MAITTYNTLSAAAQSFMLGRTDIATPMPELVMTAEHLIFHGADNMQPLRVRKMETVYDLALLPDGTGVVPADYLQWKMASEQSSPRRKLDYVPYDVFDQAYPSRPAGLAAYFTIVGETLYTAPAAQNNVELVYYAKPEALDDADGDAANSFLTAYPLVYLRAVQLAACEWLKDFEELQVQAGFLKGLIYSLNRESMVDQMAKTGTTFRKQVR